MRSLLLLFSLAAVSQALNSTIPKPDNWAVLVAGSAGWDYYRHQADVAHAYNILIHNGYHPDHIITMMFDDIVNNPENPFPGKIINNPDGPNLYPELKIDYRGYNVTPEIFETILLGQPTYAGSGKTLRSGPNDHVFVNFVGQGAVGFITFPRNWFLTSFQLTYILETMHSQNQFAKLVFYLDSCNSGSMFANILPSNISVYANTGAGPYECSHATYPSQLWKTYLGDVYGVRWMEDSDAYFAKPPPAPFTLHDLFQKVQSQVKDSHVSEYGDLAMSQEYTIDEFFACKQHTSTNSTRLASASVISNAMLKLEPAIASHDTKLEILKKMMEQNSTISLELDKELQARKEAEERFQTLASLVARSEFKGKSYINKPIAEVHNHKCLSDSIQAFDQLCHAIDEQHMRHVSVLAHLCDEEYTYDNIVTAIADNPLCSMNI